MTTRATPEGTERYRTRFEGRAAEDHFRQEQGLVLSSVGIGTYLGNPDEATDVNYTNAIARAVQLGANVIDSAANYRFQRSERSIGDALKTLTVFAREELVICTKGGYLPFDGAPPRNVREYIETTFVQPGIAKFEDFVGMHCMTPDYLQDQLDQSLRNMGIECVDVYYIHNPESQLDQIAKPEFYDRLRLAFERLEENRSSGKLAYYGVATWNGFRVAVSEQHHSFVRMVELAQQIGGDNHGFRFIQLPFNLAMPEALSVANEVLEGETINVLEAATRLGVTVVASASMLQGRVARGLPEEVRQPLGSLASDAQTAVQFVRSAPGITTALVGMSQVEHVEDILSLAEVEPVGHESFSQLFG
jgi:aryl-alcohol dehydrogenase-like predicted oxidoreductase